LSNDSKVYLAGPPVRQTFVAASVPTINPPGRAGAPSPNKHDEFCLLVNSRHPIIAVETTEEGRLDQLIFEVATRIDVPVYTWSVTTGLARMKGAPLYNSETPEQALTNIDLIHGDGIFMLKDFARYCENDRVCRRLRDLTEKFRGDRRSIVITAASLQLPPDLQGDSVPFQLGLPSAEELIPAIRAVIAQANLSNQIPIGLDAAGTTQLARNLVGLPQEEAIRTLRMCILERRRIDTTLLDAVLDAKREALRGDGVLETVRLGSSFADIAGLKRLRDWIGKRKSALTPEGQRFGLEPPKGILITGVQGCGKSLAARAVAGEWGFALARLDAGSLYDKFIGESERKLHKTLELAQKLAPMVLWIDEIEKAFASAGSSGDADAGLSQRLLATLLTWMQDREPGVFLAATSNNIAILPPEMLRKGRFDEIFFVDLPNTEVRPALFALHLKKRGRDPGAFDLPKLAAAANGFSGAEIEQAIVAALYTAFAQKQQLTTEILLAEIASTQPLSVTRAEDIQSIRDWAKTRAVPAD
jgi:ATPase family associated with various cellular activities (AAA)